MLKSFSVDNFKSLVNLTFTPAAINLLIGPNNAGKTNLCQALRFLSLTSRMSLYEAAASCTAEPWNLLNVYIPTQTLNISAICEIDSADENLTFTYELNLTLRKASQPRTTGRMLGVSTEVLRVTGGKFADTVLLKNQEGQVRLLHEKRFLRGLTTGTEPEYIETTAPTDATMLFRLYDLETNQHTNLFKKYLSAWGYYNFDPVHLRSKQARPMELTLESSGGNLSSVLYTLHNANPRVERKLIEAVRLLEPRLDLFSFQAPDPEHVHVFFEDNKGNTFGLDNVSEGTLRYLAICYLILGQRDGEEELAPVVMIEEPENGIFVGYLKELFERINPNGRQGQLIFTSHSPYFIDLFDAALEGLFILKPGETHSSLIRPDPEMIKDRLGKFSLGEMHFRGLLE